MSKSQKVDMTVQPRWGFWNIISSALGIVIVAGIVIVSGYFLLMKLFNFVWPTLQWAIPVGIYLAVAFWFSYKATQAPDNVARSHRQWQSVNLCVRLLIILFILFADMRTVVGL
ncbi:TPA: hypothetical protein DEP94_00850 [Candidatus Nomurabacteria bacterium]|nr:hypothetical protein [Candidatus Nomurabacteria bacterium]